MLKVVLKQDTQLHYKSFGHNEMHNLHADYQLSSGNKEGHPSKNFYRKHPPACVIYSQLAAVAFTFNTFYSRVIFALLCHSAVPSAFQCSYASDSVTCFPATSGRDRDDPYGHPCSHQMLKRFTVHMFCVEEHQPAHVHLQLFDFPALSDSRTEKVLVGPLLASVLPEGAAPALERTLQAPRQKMDWQGNQSPEDGSEGKAPPCLLCYTLMTV